MRAPLPVGVLVSGEGTTLDGLARFAGEHPTDFRIALVVSDRPEAGALDRARARGLPVVVVPSRPRAPDRWSQELTQALEAAGVRLVVLAGFLSILPPPWVARWEGRAVNLHPSLLPKFGGRGMHGRRVHEAVIAAGERESGVTVHLVTGEVDAGPTIAQARLPVLPGDTPESLRERLRPLEVELLAATVRRFAAGELPLPYPRGAEPGRARPAARRG